MASQQFGRGGGPDARFRSSPLATLLQPWLARTVTAWTVVGFFVLSVVESFGPGSMLARHGVGPVMIGLGTVFGAAWTVSYVISDGPIREALPSLVLFTVGVGVGGGALALLGDVRIIGNTESLLSRLGISALLAGLPWLLVGLLDATTARTTVYPDRLVGRTGLPLTGGPTEIQFDDVELVIHEPTPGDRRAGTGTYSLICAGRENDVFGAIVEPEAFEAALRERIDPPAVQYDRDDDAVGPLWRLWPTDCEIPDSAVVDGSTVESLLGCSLERLQLHDLEEVVDDDGVETLYDLTDAQPPGRRETTGED